MAVEVSASRIYPGTIDQLEEYCFDNAPLGGADCYYPGRGLLRDRDPLNPCEQTFGIVRRIDTAAPPHRNNIFARGSFDIVDDEFMVIEQPGHGVDISKLRELGIKVPRYTSGDFRLDFVRDMISIAQQLDLNAVVGISAENHCQVNGSDKIPLERGLRVFDGTFEQLRFTRLTDGNFINVLRPASLDTNSLLDVLARDYNFEEPMMPVVVSRFDRGSVISRVAL